MIVLLMTVMVVMTVALVAWVVETRRPCIEVMVVLIRLVTMIQAWWWWRRHREHYARHSPSLVPLNPGPKICLVPHFRRWT